MKLRVYNFEPAMPKLLAMLIRSWLPQTACSTITRPVTWIRHPRSKGSGGPRAQVNNLSKWDPPPAHQPPHQPIGQAHPLSSFRRSPGVHCHLQEDLVQGRAQECLVEGAWQPSSSSSSFSRRRPDLPRPSFACPLPEMTVVYPRSILAQMMMEKWAT